MIGPQLPAGQQTQPGPAELWGQQAEEVQHGHLHLLAAQAEEVSQCAPLARILTAAMLQDPLPDQA